MPESVAGWHFITKQEPKAPYKREALIYPIAYFENGIPYFYAPGGAPVVRKATTAESFWGVLADPRTPPASAWKAAQAQHDAYIRKVLDYLRETLVSEGPMPLSRLLSYAETEYDLVAVEAVLTLECFRSEDTGKGWGACVISLAEGH